MERIRPIPPPAVSGPVKIAEAYLPGILDGLVNAVNVVVKLFVMGFDPVEDIDLPPQAPRLGGAGQIFQLADQLHALFRRQEG